MMISAKTVLSLSLSVIACGATAFHGIFSNYETWCVGNCETDKIVPSTSPGVVLMGGGTDTDEAFLWQIKNAAGGDFLVLRASGDDAYNSWIYELSLASQDKLNSATTILFKNDRASSEEGVLRLINSAEAIFFAGGDQSVYLDYWMGTPVQEAVQEKSKSVSVGGTSAGCMVLGHFIYSAEKGSVTSEEALANPYDRYISLSKSFLQLPYLENLLADTHFVTRDRMGRLLTFLARIYADNLTTEISSPRSFDRTVRGLGVDEHTALLLNVSTGWATTVGVGTAYVCDAISPAETCTNKTPLTYRQLTCTRLSAKNGDKFFFGSSVAGGVMYENSVINGNFTTLPYGPKD